MLHKENNEVVTDDEKDVIIKSYKYRWIILLLYASISCACGCIIGSLYSITDTICSYYKVSQTVLLAAQNAGNAVSILALLPSSFIPSKYGLRTAVVSGAGFAALGAACFIASAQQYGYFWFVASQVLFGISNAILAQLAPEISAVWFPSHQHAIATFICIQSLAIGNGLAYIETMLIFNNVKDMSVAVFEGHLHLFMFSQAGFCLFIFFLIMRLFKDLPKHPPSISQAKRSGPGNISYLEFKLSFRILMKNWTFIVFANIFGLSYGLEIVFPLILNSLVTAEYPNGDALVGRVGAIIVAACSISSITFALVLDKSRRYKLQLFVHMIISIGLWVAFTIAFHKVLSFYIISILLISFWFSYYPVISVIVETIAEITYPIPSSISLVVCLIVGNIYGIVLNYLCGWLADRHKAYFICWLLGGELILQFVLLLGLKIKKKRTDVDEIEQ